MQTEEEENVVFWERNGKLYLSRPRDTNWPKIRKQILERDKGYCNRCPYVSTQKNVRGIWTPLGDMTVDHITPIALGGSDDRSNLQSLCPNCNKIKNGWDQHFIALKKRIKWNLKS